MFEGYGKTYRDYSCKEGDHFYSERVGYNESICVTKIRISDDEKNFYLKNNYFDNTCEVWCTDRIFNYGERIGIDGVIKIKSYNSKNILNKIKTLLMVS